MNTPHQEPSDAAAASASAAPALGPDELDEIDTLLDDLRTRGEEIPQWEFCDGFLTALICSRRPIPPSEYLPMLLGDGAAIDLAEDEPLPLLPAFADAAQQARFMELWMLRWNEVEAQLDAPVETLDDDRTFQPEAMDMRGAVASLPEDQRAEMAGQEIPSFGQVWALGFMFAVENWPEDWAAPRDKEAAKWLDDALDSIVALTEDDTGKPEVCMFSEDGPPSTSQARVEAFGEAIWAVYDLRQLWKSLGPRIETVRKLAEPGRNEPCWCGSGKKFKKCHGARILAPEKGAASAFQARAGGLFGLNFDGRRAGRYASSACSRASAWRTVAARTAARSPAKCCTWLCVCPATHQPNHTMPTGLSALPPVGPATPVTATATWACACATAPSAMARATGSLTAPCCAISAAGTPSSSVLAALE